MNVYCIEHDNKMDILQVSITDNYEVIVCFECRKDNCKTKVNVFLDSKHTNQILRTGVENL